MTTLAAILAVTSGFALAGTHRDPANLLATSLAVDASLAPLTALIAARRGRSVWLWTLIGFFFGTWAFASILLLGGPKSTQARRGVPPASDAA